MSEIEKLNRLVKKNILSDLHLEWFFGNYDVYHSDDCSYNFLKKDSGFRDDDALRKSWVFGTSGFLSQYSKYYNFVDRLYEFGMVKDNPNSLRQKINIIHLMNDCDFKPNNPIHISIYFNKSQVLDLDDENTWNDFKFFVHPGHTRVLASSFMRCNIKNNLFYVKKNKKIKIKGKSVKKLTIDEFKNTFIDKNGISKKEKNSFKIFTWEVGSEKVYELSKLAHEEKGEEYRILKLFDFFQFKNKTLTNKSVGGDYIYDTFLYSHFYFKVLFNNEVNIYSTDKDSIMDRLNDNLIKLYDKSLTKKSYSVLQDVFSDFIGGTYYKSKDMLQRIKDFKDSPFDKDELKQFNYLYELVHKLQDTKKPIVDYKNFAFKKENFYNIKNKKDKYQDIVELNQYKGFALYFDHKKCNKISFNRSLPEVLYLANPYYSIVRAEDNSFSIINCEHEFWKNKKNYKEILIPNSFYET